MSKRLDEEDETVVVSTFRVPRGVVERFDAWIDEQNRGRRGPRLSRVDVIRGLMDWAADERPAWEIRSPRQSARVLELVPPRTEEALAPVPGERFVEPIDGQAEESVPKPQKGSRR